MPPPVHELPRRALAPLTAAALALALGGCAHVEDVYKDPAGGKVARLRIVSDGMVALAPNAICPTSPDYHGPATRGWGGGTFETGRAGRAQVAQNQGAFLAGEIAGRERGAEVVVQADEPLLVRYEHQTGDHERANVCALDWVFVPREGWRYEAVGEERDRGRRCQLVVRAVADASGPLAAPAAVENLWDAEKCRR